MVWCSLSIVLILLAASLLSTIGTVRAGTNSWTPVTFPATLNVTSIAVSPAFPCDNTVFFGTDGDGVFKTTDANVDAVWTPVNTGLTDLGVLSIAISPNYGRCDRLTDQGDRTLFVATRSGLFRSTNGGGIWNPKISGLPTGKTILALGVSPNYASDRTVFAGTDGALFRSTDQGESWLPLDAGLTDRSIQAFALSSNFANDSALFLGTRFSGVYRWAAKLSEPRGVTPTPTPTATPQATPTPRVTSATHAAPTPSPDPPHAGAAAPTTSGDDRTIQQAPALRLTKRAGDAANGATYQTAPGPVVFEYEVKNIGDTDLFNIVVVDDNGTPGATTDDLFVGMVPQLPGRTASTPPSFSILTKTIDVNQDRTNTARATGFYGVNLASSVTASDTATVDVVGTGPFAAIKLIKRAGDAADGAVLTTRPGSVAFTYEVKNVGTILLQNIVVTDDNGTPGNTTDDAFIGMIPSLEPLAFQILTKSLLVDEDRTNTGTARGFYGATLQSSVTTQDNATVQMEAPTPGAPITAPGQASIRLIALIGNTLDGEIYYTVPGPVTHTYILLNDGLETITDVVVKDANYTLPCRDDPKTPDLDETIDDVIVGTLPSLSPGQVVTFTQGGTVRPAEEGLGADVTFKPLRTIGCATGLSATRGPVHADDDAVVQLVVWQSITPSNSELTDLWVTSFATSPFFANDQTIFAGTAYGGLYKSSDAASSKPTWTRVNPGLEPEWVWVRAIALSPRYPNDRTIFVGTEGGIFKGVEGTDGRVTWTAMSAGLTRLDVRALAISPDFGRDHVLFAGVFGNDVYRLRDGGPTPTWEPQRRITTGLWTWAVELTQEGVALAGSWGRGIARKVLPSGDDWNYPLLPGAVNAEVTALAKSPGYCVGYALFAGTWAHGLFKSVNGGSTWSPVSLPSGTLPIRDVVISPAYDKGHTLLVATWGQGIFLSLDDGVTWTSMNAGLPDLRVRALAVTPNYPFDPTVYAGTDTAGVLRWDAASQQWIGINSGLTNLTVMTIAVSPQFSTDGTVLVGIWGGGIFRSQNRGDSWDPTSSGLGNYFVRALAFSPGYATDRKVYAGTHQGPFRSTDGGNSWQLLGTPGDEVSFVDVTDFAFTTTLPRTVFASTGGRGIWQFTEMETSQALRALPAQFAYRAFIPMVSKTRGVPPC